MLCWSKVATLSSLHATGKEEQHWYCRLLVLHSTSSRDGGRRNPLVAKSCCYCCAGFVVFFVYSSSLSWGWVVQMQTMRQCFNPSFPYWSLWLLWFSAWRRFSYAVVIQLKCECRGWGSLVYMSNQWKLFCQVRHIHHREWCCYSSPASPPQNQTQPSDTKGFDRLPSLGSPTSENRLLRCFVVWGKGIYVLTPIKVSCMIQTKCLWEGEIIQCFWWTSNFSVVFTSHTPGNNRVIVPQTVFTLQSFCYVGEGPLKGAPVCPRMLGSILHCNLEYLVTPTLKNP